MEAKVNGVACELLDSVGRLIVSPNAMSVEGQTNTPVDLRENETLDAFLRRHVEGISPEGWAVALNGYEVKSEDWAVTYPSVGQVIAVRARVGKAALQLVAIAALTYFTFGFGTVAAGAGYVAGAIGTVGAMGVYIAGSILINKVLGPKVPEPGVVDQGATQFSLRDQRNQPRQYEPLPIVWGVVRVTPDLASKSYTTYEGNEQYMQMILLAGINVQNMDNLSIGDTALSQYDGVELYYDHVPAQEQKSIPIFTNADSIAGADLVNGDTAGIVRTTSVDTLTFQVDIEGQLYDTDNKGNTKTNSVSLKIESAVTGTDVWTTNVNTTLSNASTALVRRTYTVSVPKGQYDVRVSMGTPTWNEGGNADACKFAFQTLRSIQEDNADYSRLGRLGARIKASGQLTGSLDTVQADMTAKPMPIWTPTGWQTATTRENGLSNPGAVMLKALRGVYSDDGELLWGAGYPDEMIDIESYKSFMLYCTAKGFTYDKWVTAGVTIGDFLDEVALAGLAEFSYVDGSRPSVVFVAADQPLSGVIGMANMAKGSFGVDYTLSNAADGIEYKYLDRNRNWELQTLRVAAPGKTTMLNPAQLTGEGVTTEAQAAMLARYHLAQSLYQYKTISYGSDLESLDYRRLSIVSLSHDMTQWGVSGRLLAISKDSNGIATVNLDMDVPPHATPYIGFRIHGERDYRVFEVSAVTEATDTITLAEPWPEDLPFPGEDGGMIYDVLWCYDFKETPGYRVRVVDMESEEEMVGAKVTCVPESPEFWTYVETGEYTPPPVQQVRPRDVAVISNLKVTEQTNIQGDTEWYEFTATWDIEGDYDHAQVWAGIDGSELRMVDGNAMGASSTFRIDTKGSWLIRVIPFNSRGQAGLAQALLYITVGVDLPPRNPSEFYVQLVEGSLRRFAWNYTQKPAAFSGVQIRYVPGDVPLSVADWDSMTPIGQPDDIYSGAFITTKPDAGTYSFGLRAVNTAGILSEGIVRTVATLDNVFDNILQPDLTPPPTPTGFEVATAFANAMLSTDAVNYTEGHGPDKTIFYVAEITEAKPNPVFADARIAAEVAGTMGSAPVSLGHKYRWWAKWQSADGVLSVLSTAPVDSQVGLIGGSDLADDIITAEKLANGSITADKLADGAVDITKFASGLEPILVVDTLPTEKKTTTVSYDGKIYRWDGTKYTAEIPTVDLIGQISVDQIPDGALNATKFASGIEPITILDHIPVQKQTETISVNGKLYHWEQDRYTANVEAADIVGKITGIQIADGALNINNFTQGIEPVSILPSVPANKVTSAILVGSDLYRWDGTKYVNDVKAQNISGQIGADQLATGAVTNDKIAAGVIDAGKFASDVEPVKILSAVPNYKVTSVISVGGVMYRWNGTKYTNAVTAVEIEGQISGDQIKANALDATKFASSIEPVTLVSAIPAVKVTSVISYNGVMYRWDGAKYTRNVATSELEGQIVDQQIAAGAVSAAKFAGNIEPVTIVAALPVTKVTSVVSFNGVMYRWDGTKYTVQTPASDITGQLTSAQIASLETAKLAGQITETQIADNSISTPKILAGAVMAQQIAAGAIVAGKISADAVQAGNLAAGSVVAGKIAADAVQAANIAAGAVQATHIAAKAITAEKLVIGSAANLLPDTSDWGIDGGGSRWDGMGMGAQIGNSSKWVRDKYIGTLAASFEVQAGITYLASIEASPTNYSRIVMELIPEGPTEFNPRQFILDVNAAATDPATFTTYSAKFTPTASQRVRLRLFLNDNGAAGLVWIRKPVISPMSDGSLIVDGAITAGKIAANSITASKLVVSDNSTLVPDAEYQDASMWGEAPGTVSLVYEPSGYAGTVSNRVARLDRSSHPYEWHCVFSKPFALQPKTNYALRASVYVPFACHVISRLRTYDSPSGDGNLIEKYHDLVAGWHKLEWSGITGELASSGQIFMFVGSGSPFMLVGKIMVTEAVSAALIVDGAIIASKIAAGAITSDKIVAGAISTDKLAANSVTALNLAAGAVTTAKLAAGAVVADTIAAGAVTAAKLVVTDTSSVNIDPTFQDSNFWNDGNNFTAVKQIGDGVAGPNVFYSVAGYSTLKNANKFNIDYTKTYLFEVWVRKIGPSDGTEFASARFFDSAGNLITANLNNYWPISFAAAGNCYWPSPSTALPVGAWTRYTTTCGPDGVNKFPPGATQCAVGVFFNYNSTSPAEVQYNCIRVTEMSRAELIVDGAITANKIAANSITASKLVVADYSTLMPDSEYQDTKMWTALDGGTFNFQSEHSSYAGTLNKVVLRLNHVENGQGYDGVLSSPFSVTPDKEYAVRINMYVHAPARILVRAMMASGVTPTRNIDTEKVLDVGQWFTFTTSFTPNSSESAVRLAIYIWEQSTSRYVLIGKIRVQEAISTGLLVEGAVTASKVAANAITADKIAANAITAGKLAAGAVTAGTLAAGVVTATEIAAGTITASRMAIGDASTMVPDPEYADRSMWRAAGAGSVLDIVPTSGAFGTANNRALKLYVGTERYSALFSKEFSVVPGRTYTAKTVFYADAKAYAIFRVVMIDTVLGTERYNEYTTSVGSGYDYPIVTVQPTARENAMRIEVWLDKTNTVSNIVMGKVKVQEAIDATLIVDGAVIADKLATNSVVSSKIAAGSVTTDKLVANVITADKLAAGSVTAGKLAADSVTAGVIAAGAISAREIAAGAITTNKLVVNGQGTCITDDPTLLDAPNAWVYPANVSVAGTAGGSASTNKYFYTTTQAIVYNRRTVSIDPNKVYNLSASFYTDAGDTGMMHVLIDMFDALGNQVGTSWGGAFSGYAWYGVPAAGNWNRYGAQIGLGTAKPIPANVRTARIGAIMKYQRPTDNGIVQGATDFRLEQASGAELIVDGAIIASKIAVNAVTADKIEANAITSDKIAANAITADKIAANSITAAKIAAGSVTTSHIASDSITASKIIVSDNTTLIRDPEYRDSQLWGSSLGNLQLTYEPSGYAGTVSRLVARVDRGTHPYEWHSLYSAEFAVTPGRTYVIRAWIYTPQACTIILRGSLIESPSNTERIIETYVAKPSGWYLAETRGNTILESKASVHVFLGSGSPFMLVGKIKFQEATDSTLIVDGAITATKLAANSIVAGTAAIQNGAIVNAMIANATIDSAKIASLSATKITAGYMQVGSYIASNNFARGSAGFIVEANGNAEFNNITARGNIYSSNGNIGGVRINGNGLNTGSYSGYAWPTGGGTGFHLGPGGLLFGNSSTGKYIEIQQGGNLFAPGFRLQDGNAYFSGQLNIQSASSGARLVINNSKVLVYDGNNTLRVRLGIW